jgi:hypothetical protein
MIPYLGRTFTHVREERGNSLQLQHIGRNDNRPRLRGTAFRASISELSCCLRNYTAQTKCHANGRHA